MDSDPIVLTGEDAERLLESLQHTASPEEIARRRAISRARLANPTVSPIGRPNRLHQAQLILSAWRLVSSSPIREDRLDVALQEAFCLGLISDLTFVEGPVRLVCVELPEILDWAWRAELLSGHDASFQLSQVGFGPDLAKKLLAQLGISEEHAIELGRVLVLASHPSSM